MSFVGRTNDIRFENCRPTLDDVHVRTEINTRNSPVLKLCLVLQSDNFLDRNFDSRDTILEEWLGHLFRVKLQLEDLRVGEIRDHLTVDGRDTVVVWLRS